MNVCDFYVRYRLKIKFSDEEQAENNRIGIEYQRFSTRANNKMQRDLYTRFALAKEALAALPENLREAALIPKPLSDRPETSVSLICWYTPPIKGFVVEDYVKDKSANTSVDEI